MDNPLWDKMVDSLESGSFFSQTLVPGALEFIKDVDRTELVNVAVIGDVTINNVPAIMRAFATLARYFSDPDMYQVLVGDLPGVEEVIRRACKKNGLKLVPIGMPPEEDDTNWSCRRTMRNRQILKNAHVVLIITDGTDRVTDTMYREAQDMGRIVMKRIIRKKS